MSHTRIEFGDRPPHVIGQAEELLGQQATGAAEELAGRLIPLMNELDHARQLVRHCQTEFAAAADRLIRAKESHAQIVERIVRMVTTP